VRWSFLPHAVLLDGIDPAAAPTRSAAVVRGRWWRTAGTVAVLTIIGAAPGPMIGIALMVLAGAGVQFVNALSSLIYAAVLPFAILGTAILSRRRQGRSVSHGAEQARASVATEPRPGTP
jgi:hypothetical protein